MQHPWRILNVGILGAMLAAGVLSAAGQDHSFVRARKLTIEPAAAKFSKVGPLATNLWTFSALSVFDARLKTDVLYITSFNSASLGQLIRLDYRHNRAQTWTMPVGIGSWGIFQGQDGNIYLGSYNGGEMLCFDPRTEKWLHLPQAPEEFRKQEFIICDLAEAPNGDIYYGTYPGAHLVHYDRRAGTVTDLGRAADENYLRRVKVTRGGMVLCGVGTRQPRLIAYDPRAREFRDLTPPDFQVPGGGNPLVSSRFIVDGAGGGKVLVYDARSLKFLRTFDLHERSLVKLIEPDQLVYEKDNRDIMQLNLATGKESVYCANPGVTATGRWHMTPSGDLIGLRVQSYIYVDKKTGKHVLERIPVDGLGQVILWLNTFPTGQIYGGPELGQTVFSYHPQTHVLESYDQVIDEGGEVYYGIPYHAKLYTISYIEATLAVFDPSRPWHQGRDADSNPRTILHIPEEQYRPEGGIHLGPGGQMYIGTQPDYGKIGGALTVFDPVTEKLEVHRNIIPDEEISAVAADSHFVYCGADIHGGGGSKPVATQGHFFVWDPRAGKIVFDDLLPTGAALHSIAALHGHAYFVLEDRLMDYDSGTRTLTGNTQLDKRRPVPQESLKAAQDGTLWGILGKELAHIDPRAHKVEFFPETAGHATEGLAIGLDGTIYFGCETEMWIYHPHELSPPAAFE